MTTQSDSASSVQMMQMCQCGVSPLWKGIELHPSTPEALESSAVACSTGVSEVLRGRQNTVSYGVPTVLHGSALGYSSRVL
jgi:hypothetical protein